MKHLAVLTGLWVGCLLLFQSFGAPVLWVGAGAFAWVWCQLIADEVDPSWRLFR